MPSTGPTTEAGKAASSRNAVKHGLLSEALVVTALETHDDWQAHRDGVLADLAPRGQMETCLAERAALLIWRLRRTAEAEVTWLNDSIGKRPRPDIPSHSEVDCLTRYEAHLGRELARTMKALKDLQSRPASTADQPEISNQHSPISNSGANCERTLNGSTPIAVDNADTALSGGTTENYQTNSTLAEGDSETPTLHHSLTPADSNASPSDEPTTSVEQKNCETNSPAPPQPTPDIPHPNGSAPRHPTPDTPPPTSVPAPPGYYWSFERRCFRPLPTKPREA